MTKRINFFREMNKRMNNGDRFMLFLFVVMFIVLLILNAKGVI